MKIINTGSITELLERALSLVDVRLVDHGYRVAYLVCAMMRQDGGYSERELQEMWIAALLHDIGAYRTEEIDELVKLETGPVWEHAVYGAILIRELSPVPHLSEAVMYHHMDSRYFTFQSPQTRKLAQLLHLADRVDIYCGARAADLSEIESYLLSKKGIKFDPEVVELFLQTEKEWHILEKLQNILTNTELSSYFDLSEDDVRDYLTMLIYAIDFRSKQTVTHTVLTTHIAHQLARRMGLDEDSVLRVHYGAMLHDVGKIGIPVRILEKAGSLSEDEMEIMRKHVVLTGVILGDSVDEEITLIALRHHEKLDGSGYPLGLSAQDLSLEQRIVAVADIVSALHGSRSYKQAMHRDEVVSIIENEKEQGKLDGNVIDVMTSNFDEIMDAANRISAPIIEAYENINDQYLRLLPIVSSGRAGG